MFDLAACVPWDFRTADLAVMRREVARRLKPFVLNAGSLSAYDARFCYRRLPEVELSIIQYGETTAIDAGRMGDFYILQIPLTGHYLFRTEAGGFRVEQGQAHLIHPQAPLAMEFSPHCRLLVLRFADRHIAQLEQRRRHAAAAEDIGYLLSLADPAGSSLGRVVDYLVTELTHGDLLQRKPAVAAVADQLLLGCVLDAIESYRTALPDRSADYLERVQRYVLEHLDQDLSLQKILAVADVSTRTLFRRFNAVHGTGPMSWVRIQRLCRVRAELLNAAAAGVKVSEIASRWGFTHFGHFCAAYRQLHGETPSQTLRARRRWSSRQTHS